VGAAQSQALGRIQYPPAAPDWSLFADFCCVARHLIIELDGSQHAELREERKDELRTAYLNQ
jgi:very-short-patch-repair endonuclease